MQPSQYEIQREVEALRDIRRRSTAQGGPGTLILDPDLPITSASSSPTSPTYWTAASSSALTDASSSGSSSRKSSSSMESISSTDSDDPFHLFWVPASVHPEIAPAEFKAFIKEHARAPAGDGVSSRPGSLSSSPSLNRKKSMLSRQYRPTEGDAEEKEEKILPLRRNRSVFNNQGPQLTINDLQKLEELAEEASQNDDPTKLRTILRRSLSLNMSPSVVETMEDAPDMPDEANLPIIVPPPGQILRRAARTKIRKPSLQGDGGGHRFASTRRGTRGATAEQDQQRLSTETSASDLDATTPPPRRNRTVARESKGQDDTSKRDTKASIFDAYARDEEDEEDTQTLPLVSSPPPITVELPTPLPPPEEDSPPMPILRQPQPQRLSVPSSTADHKPSPRTPSPDRSGLPIPPMEASMSRSPPQQDSSYMSPTAQQDPSYVSPTAQQEPPYSLSTSPQQEVPYLSSSPQQDSPYFVPTSPQQDAPYFIPSSPQQDAPYLVPTSPKQETSYFSPTSPQQGEPYFPSTSPQRKEKDKKGLFGKWGSDREKKKSGKDKERENRERVEKEKESGFFGSLFGGKKKQDDSMPSSLTSGAGRETAAALLGASKSSKSPISATSPSLAGIGGSYARYPLHVERAIYRLSHIKLANPRRPLYEQVLISNLMFWYLGVINRAQNPSPPPSSTAPAATTQSEKELKEREAKEKAEKEKEEQERLEKERFALEQKKETRRGSLTKPGVQGTGRRAAEMPVRGPQYEMQHMVIEQEYTEFAVQSTAMGRPASAPIPIMSPQHRLQQLGPPKMKQPQFPGQPPMPGDYYYPSGGGGPGSQQGYTGFVPQQRAGPPQLPPGAMSPASVEQQQAWLSQSPPSSAPRPRPSLSPSPPPTPSGNSSTPSAGFANPRRSRSPPPSSNQPLVDVSPGEKTSTMGRTPGRSLSAVVSPPTLINGKGRKGSATVHAVSNTNGGKRRPRTSEGAEEDVPLALWQQQRRR